MSKDDDKKRQRELLDSERAHDGRSKVDRYKWSSLNEPGELAWLDKRSLNIDHGYQRELNENKVKDIASNFNWRAFGVLNVARRPDGHLFVFDAQHRLAAAMRRADVDIVPCIVFNIESRSGEAQSFLDSNVNRKPVTAIDKFGASELAGNELAGEVRRLVDLSGRSIGKTTGPNTVRCVALMGKLLRQDAAVMERIWPVCVDLCEGNGLHERVLGGLFYIERNLPSGTSIASKRWAERLRKVGLAEVTAAINAATAFYSKGGERVYAAGILKAINKGLQESAQLKIMESAS